MGALSLALTHPPPSSDTEKDITVLLDLLFSEKMTWATQIVMVMALGLAHQIESQRAGRSVVDDRHDRKGFDCNDSRLSPKARRMFCREVEVTSRPGRETQETSAVTPSSPLLEPRVTYSPTEKPWSKPESALTVTVPGTTTQDWLNAIPECSDLVPGLDDMGQECKNSTTPPPTIRYRDMVFERLIAQSWEDMQSKINVEKQVKGINLEPLNVDKLAGTVGPLLEVSESAALYSAQLRMWDVKVFGLADIYLSEVLVTRDQTLYDLKMMAQFRFDNLTANGMYNINGSVGGWFGSTFTSGGDRPFSVDITNATFTPRLEIDTSAIAPCGKNGDVQITDIEFPFSYDDISIMFDNLGYGYNAVINGLSIFILKTQEENLKGMVRSAIKDTVHSIIC